MASETWRDDNLTGDGEWTSPQPGCSTSHERRTVAGPAPTIRETNDDERRGQSGTSNYILRLPTELAGRWRIIRELPSRGAEADLLVVTDEAGGLRVAKIYRAGIHPKPDLHRLIGGSSFEHVVRLFDHGQSDGRWYELLEYIELGALDDFIRSEGPKCDEAFVGEVLVEVLKAVRHLHMHGVVHRDIKPANILVRSRQPLSLVLTDFGIASSLGGGSRHYTSANRTIAYAAPEAAAGEISKASDWWSMGIILVEMLTGRHPFSGARPGELIDERAIASRLAQMPVDQLVDGVREPWKTLCRGLLRRDAKHRWTDAEVIRWVQRDPDIVVANEAPLGAQHPSFFFAGNRYNTLPEIAQALSANWQEARKTIERGHLFNWVKDDLRDNEWRQFLSDLDRDCLDVDERVFRIILKLDPTIVPVFCGYRLDPEGLQILAGQALASKGSAPSNLAPFYDRGILLIAAEATGIASYRELHNRWNAQLENYKSQADAVVRAGAPRAPIDQSRDQARATMLLSALPSGQRYIGELRRYARNAAKPELQDCDWYRALGDGSRASPQTAFLIALLASHAEAPAAEVKRVRTQVQAEARAARNLLLTRLGFVGAALAGVVAWFLWYNSPANVAARQEQQRQQLEQQRQQELARQRQLEQQRQQELARQREIEQQRQQELAHQREIAVKVWPPNTSPECDGNVVNEYVRYRQKFRRNDCAFAFRVLEGSVRIGKDMVLIEAWSDFAPWTTDPVPKEIDWYEPTKGHDTARWQFIRCNEWRESMRSWRCN